MNALAFAIASALLAVPCEYHIDCSGWPGGATNEFEVRITALDGTTYTSGVELLPESTVATARDLIWFGLERKGWRGYPAGKGILVLQGSQKSAIRSVEFKSKGWKPDVRLVLTAPAKK